ncbi:AcrR family transcriptional regulator [Saccharopolyspora lacisalsi]|uniref:AcrR family transcriptional regulator n=1 Tax=Halosaccharopolyspora lacisalsi TaxID=1000566 RepID=A0A839DT21_9PSEU|nr:TetR/AcrR family transcriptional regulator [Halosaccharopolyspora lacisalsi]MBA8824654.1 AcrR family transcriptional regulator [Halosaccharopolyspora lacisalsi]
MASDRLTEILDATYECLTRYGIRRTTMDDIATTVGVSRSAVYQYVRSKDDAVRRLVERLHHRTLAQAAEVAATDRDPAERVHGVLTAKLDLVLDLAGDSAHAAELLDAKARLYGDICADFTTRLKHLLTDVFTDAGLTGIAPADAADISIALVVGLESHPDARRLLGPATESFLAGLPGMPARGH